MLNYLINYIETTTSYNRVFSEKEKLFPENFAYLEKNIFGENFRFLAKFCFNLFRKKCVIFVKQKMKKFREKYKAKISRKIENYKKLKFREKNRINKTNLHIQRNFFSQNAPENFRATFRSLETLDKNRLLQQLIKKYLMINTYHYVHCRKIALYKYLTP